jgi:TolB-like protein/Tfp pilus assembly protein PilF
MALNSRKSPILFGDFEVDLASGELRRQGVRIKLQEQPFQALAALIERPGEVLTRRELQQRIWPEETTVDFDRGLNKAINRLREALGDDADEPLFIETLPQRGYRFLAKVETAPIPSPPRIESIAVLPLENLSSNPGDEYFSDGMTDELIGEIARIGSLRVISRTSIMQYKSGVRKSLTAIAHELNVDAILEGTVAHAGEKVRITAQLIRAHNDQHLWSQKYERPVTDILSLQSEVARAIAAEVQATLSPQEQTYLARSRPVNPEAYDAFLKGKFFLHQGIRGVSKSIEFFKQAIALDSVLAEYHAGLAEALCYARIFGFRPSAETHSEARVAALKALELDESNAAAHNALASVKEGHDWDLIGAEVEYQRALQLNPSRLLTRLWYAACLAHMGRYREAIEESGRALALDPVSPIAHNNRAMLFFRARRYDEAIGASQQALDLDPSFVNAIWWQGAAYAGNGNFTRSIACLKLAISMNDVPLFRALLGHVYGRAGEDEKANRILEELMEFAKQRYVSPMDFAVVYAGLGDRDSTFHWLEQAYQAHAARVLEMPSMYFDLVRSDSRYTDLMRRVGLTS